MIPVDTLSPDVAVCVTCADKLRRRMVGTGYDLSKVVGQDVDEQLARSPIYKDFLAREAARHPRCHHCDNFVVVGAMGRTPLWCDECERARKKLELGIKS